MPKATKRRTEEILERAVQKSGNVLKDVEVFIGYIEIAAKIHKKDSLGEPMYDDDGNPVTITASAVRNYLYQDMKLGEPNLMPKPDAVLIRDNTVIPLWKESTVDAWIPDRQGPGNHTWGDLRRGNTSGRQPKAVEPAAV